MSIGFLLPLERGNKGFFNVSEDLLTQIKSNLINLILTIKGERTHNPTFGCDIHNIIFDFNNDDFYSKARNSIEDAINIWMPYIELEEFHIDTTDSDKLRYTAKMYIKYRLVENTNISDEIFIKI